MDKHITAPITSEVAKTLHSGDYVYITGTIYTARDAAHKRMAEALKEGKPLPIDMKNNVIYYMVVKDYNLIYGLVKVSTGVLKLVKLSVCNALNGKLKYKR